MKIVSTGKTISTTEYLERKRRREHRRLVIYAILAVTFCVLAVFFLKLSRFQITNIKISGAVSTSPQLVEEVVTQILVQKYLWLIPHSNAFIYPNTAIKKMLLRKFPRFSSVEINLEGLKTLRVTAIEREPFALYCAPDVCYFLDDLGFIFDTAPIFSEGVYFNYSLETPLEAPLGSQFLPVSEFEALSGFVEKIKDLGVAPTSLILSREEVDLKLEGGALIKWERTADLSGLSANLEAFLGSEAIKGQKDFWSKLSVLDMRTPNKVFYSFRE